MNQITIEFGVGKELRAARLKAELKIADVAEELNLTVEHLTAIEKDNYDELPGTTYVIGFVRSYARFLGLNDAHMIDRLVQGGLVSGVDSVKPPVEDADVDAPVTKGLVGSVLLVALLLSVLVGAFFYLKAQSESNESIMEGVSSPEEQMLEEDKSLGTTPTAEAEKILQNEEVEANANVVERKPLKLVGTKPEGARILLTAIEDAWFQVYHPVTRKVYQNTVLKAGQSIWVPAYAGLLMDLGRPHMMELTIDGENYGTIGPSWGGVIKKLPTNAQFLIHDYYGEGLHEKSYNRWLSKQSNNS